MDVDKVQGWTQDTGVHDSSGHSEMVVDAKGVEGEAVSAERGVSEIKKAEGGVLEINENLQVSFTSAFASTMQYPVLIQRVVRTRCSLHSGAAKVRIWTTTLLPRSCAMSAGSVPRVVRDIHCAMSGADNGCAATRLPMSAVQGIISAIVLRIRCSGLRQVAVTRSIQHDPEAEASR
eukprot:1735599-Rhodomonas_salina.2